MSYLIISTKVEWNAHVPNFCYPDIILGFKIDRL